MRTRTPRSRSVAGSRGRTKVVSDKIHLPRQGLHLLVAEPAGIGKHRQRIALERPRRKDVELHEGKTAKIRAHGVLL